MVLVSNTLTKFSQSALNGRSKVIEWFSIKTPQFTDAQTAKILTNNAVQLGLIESRTIVHGKTLRSWCKERDGSNIQFWAAVSAVDLLIKIGWLPSKADEWSVWSSSLVRTNEPLKSPESFDKLIPDSMARETAYKWLQLALNDSEAYKKAKAR